MAKSWPQRLHFDTVIASPYVALPCLYDLFPLPCPFVPLLCRTAYFFTFQPFSVFSVFLTAVVFRLCYYTDWFCHGYFSFIKLCSKRCAVVGCPKVSAMAASM